MTDGNKDSAGTVAELRALLDKASPGPWQVNDSGVDLFIERPEGEHGPDDYVAELRALDDRTFAERDAALIAALRNAAPDLLRVVERLAEAEPLVYFPQGGGFACSVCDGPCSKSPVVHDAECPWVTARKLCGR